MSSAGLPGRTTRRGQLDTGPFVLQSLIKDVPLSAEGDNDDIKINCVEFLDQNLYIGTSAAEILHFVGLPPDPSSPSDQPTFILASRLCPTFAISSTSSSRPGVQQILLLPTVNKACVLCNWTVTFYSLPELSPVYEGVQVRNCSWIGGADLNVDPRDPTPNGVTILMSHATGIRVIRVREEEPRKIRSVEFAGSIISVRRDSFACVADTRSYALLDVDRRLKIPLFPISSLDESQAGHIGQVEDISGAAGGVSRSSSVVNRGHHSTLSADDRGHGRSSSLGAFIGGQARQGGSGSNRDSFYGRETPDRIFRQPSPGPSESSSRPSSYYEPGPGRSSLPDKPLPVPPADTAPAEQGAGTPAERTLLKPNIVSPSPQEFLLTTGTGPTDPGVGMFVNLEGDVTRSTLEFDHYPEGIVADGRGVGIDITPTNAEDDEEGYILAIMSREFDKGPSYGLEIQRWDLEPGVGEKFWLEVASSETTESPVVKTELGIRSVLGSGEVFFDDVVERLCLKRFRPFPSRSVETSTLSLKSLDSRTATSLEKVSKERELFETQDAADDTPLPEGWEENRIEEEKSFARRLAQARSKVVVWSHESVWWVVRNPLALRLDATLVPEGVLLGSKEGVQLIERSQILETLRMLQGREARTEAEFVSLGYLRQRAGILLVISLLQSAEDYPSDDEYAAAEEALVEGALDPRVVLALIPELRNEVVQSRAGIWIYGGVREMVESYILGQNADDSSVLNTTLHGHVMLFLRRYLITWRKKKGFGSIANEAQVFQSIDAALLIVLLELDKTSPMGPARPGTVRAELNKVVDEGVDCFDRAVAILETYDRLYVLSRLYQSRRMASEVLATWKRIILGETDKGGEFRDGEQRLREHLTRLSNASLVQEYGIWLATRNPKLGVQVFADDNSKVKFDPIKVVSILRDGAPGAVKEYLEYLVFGKNHVEYVNELIAYYLDNVIGKLETSPAAKETLAESYEAYRALRAPKPTYRQFITDNSVPGEWWHSRLRLLQLLGGSHASAADYDVEAIRQRIEPYTQELVPEVIILDGRQSRHEEALKLLTHGLGDFDTAIRYCLFGGSSIYHLTTPGGLSSTAILPTRDEQAKLFGVLLAEFLQIKDVSDRVDQTSSLLERFGGWLDVGYVLSVIPDTWSVELLSGFLVSALRRIMKDRSESMVAKALSAAENLRVNADLVDKIEAKGPEVQAQE